MSAQVYFSTMRASLRRNLLHKVDRLLEKTGLFEALNSEHLVAVKCHVGEHGNTAFLRPVFVRQVVLAVQKTGAKAFVTDTNTLYRGSRSDAVVHQETAAAHGFTHATLGAPFIVADGLRGRAAVETPIKGRHFDQVAIAEAVARADALVVLSHFKLHEATGFGGAIKNLGMGCAPREGKLLMHSSVSPEVDSEACTGDGICVRACTFDAISLVDNVATIDPDKCTGCAECLGVCPHDAIGPAWDQALERLAEYMAEFALGATQGKTDRAFYVNFVTQVSPACDCYSMSDASIIPDLGIFASTDPVALDQACLDALRQAPGLPNTALSSNALAPGEDKIKDLYPTVPYLKQLEHAEAIGLGRREYELIALG